MPLHHMGAPIRGSPITSNDWLLGCKHAGLGAAGCSCKGAMHERCNTPDRQPCRTPPNWQPRPLTAALPLRSSLKALKPALPALTLVFCQHHHPLLAAKRLGAKLRRHLHPSTRICQAMRANTTSRGAAAKTLVQTKQYPAKLQKVESSCPQAACRPAVKTFEAGKLRPAPPGGASPAAREKQRRKAKKGGEGKQTNSPLPPSLAGRR